MRTGLGSERKLKALLIARHRVLASRFPYVRPVRLSPVREKLPLSPYDLLRQVDGGFVCFFVVFNASCRATESTENITVEKLRAGVVRLSPPFTWCPEGCMTSSPAFYAPSSSWIRSRSPIGPQTKDSTSKELRAVGHVSPDRLPTVSGGGVNPVSTSHASIPSRGRRVGRSIGRSFSTGGFRESPSRTTAATPSRALGRTPHRVGGAG